MTRPCSVCKGAGNVMITHGNISHPNVCGKCQGTGLEEYRPSMQKIMMQMAENISVRSTCKTPNRHIGCVITNSDFTQVYSNGYNGTAKGDSNECDYASIENNPSASRCSCVHAEMNAIAKLRLSANESNLIMFVTLFPCQICAKLIVNAERIRTIYYKEDYKNNEAMSIFNTANIKVVKFIE